MSGLPVARVGDSHQCPVPGHGTTPIQPNGASMRVGGQPVARVGDKVGCGAVLTRGYPLCRVDGLPIAHLGSLSSHGGNLSAPTQTHTLLGWDPTTTPITDFDKAGALDADGQLRPEVRTQLNEDPMGFIRQAAAMGAVLGDVPEEIKAESEREAGETDPAPGDPAGGEDSAAAIPEPQVRVEAGIFFDGTGNNRDNTLQYQQMADQCLTAQAAGQISAEECGRELAQIMEGSYLNAETNVSKLEGLYSQNSIEDLSTKTHHLSIYVSGVGTKSGEEDNVLDMGTGMGERGILSKAEIAALNLAREISRKTLEPLEELVLDVFGFSRGAATARHFVNAIWDGASGLVGQALTETGLSWPKRVRIRFLGLFDTVAAVVDVGSLDLSAHDADTGPVRVGIRPDQVERAVHLVAADERRHNFSLNSLRGAQGQLPGHFSEWVLPGVHSDIGGGYPDPYREHLEVARPLEVSGWAKLKPYQSFEYERMTREQARIEAEGWVRAYNPDARTTIRREGPRRVQRLRSGPVTLHLWLDREVKAYYSRITLYLMHSLATKAGVPFKDVPTDNPQFTLPTTDLLPVASALSRHVLDGQNLMIPPEREALLHQRYIHHSHHWGAIGPVYPHQPTPSGQRAVHPNPGIN